MSPREPNVKATIDILRRIFVNRGGPRTELSEEHVDYPATGKNMRPEDLQVYRFAQHSSVHFCNYCGCTLDCGCLSNRFCSGVEKGPPYNAVL
jgi:hypothetical protein